MIRRLAEVGLLVLLISDAAHGGSASLVGALDEYEGRLTTLCGQGTPREQTAALESLALVGSDRFDACLERLLDLEDPYRLRDVCVALGRMGGEHPRAMELLGRALRSTDHHTVVAALRAAKKADTLIPFEAAWDRERPLVLWAGELPYIKPSTDIMTGVAAAEPWDDPVWSILPAESRIYILGRAATTEALQRLERHLATGPSIATVSLRRASAEIGPHADIGKLRAYLSSDKPELRRYAAASLAPLGEPSVLRDLLMGWNWQTARRALSAMKSLPPEVCADLLVETCSKSDGISRLIATSHQTLRRLNDGALYRLARARPNRLLEAVARELLARGRPLTAGQLAGDEPMPDGEPLPEMQDTSGDRLVIPLARIVRERDFEELGRLLTEGDDPETAFGVAVWLRCAPGFVSLMPDSLRAICRQALRDWLDENCDAATDDPPDEQALRVFAALGIFEELEDRNERWRRWLNDEAPLDDWQTLAALIGRQDGLGILIRSNLRTMYHGLPSSAREIVDALVRKPTSAATCPATRISLELEGPSRIPPPAVARARRDLENRVHHQYAGQSRARLSMDFLADRTGRHCDELHRSAIRELSDDPRDAVASHAELLLQELGRICWHAEWADPKAVPDGAAKALAHLLRAEQLRNLGETVECLRSTEGRKRLAASPILRQRFTPPPPRGRLLHRFSTVVLPQLRRLIDAENPDVRSEASWATWWMTGDPVIPALWATWAQDAQPPLAARALALLGPLERTEDVDLFLASLTHEAPVVRAAALGQLMRHRPRHAVPAAVTAIADPDRNVSDRAIRLLGRWRFPETAGLLVDLCTTSDRSTANEAARALSKFHRADLIDLILQRAQHGTDREVKMLLRAFGGAVLGLHAGSLPEDVSRDTVEAVSAYRDWWAAVRVDDEYGWLRPAVDQAVGRLGVDCRSSWRRAGLGKLFGFEVGPRDCRNLVAWLEAVPEEDLWRLVLNPFNDSVDPALGCLDRDRAARWRDEVMTDRRLGSARTRAARYMLSGRERPDDIDPMTSDYPCNRWLERWSTWWPGGVR